MVYGNLEQKDRCCAFSALVTCLALCGVEVRDDLTKRLDTLVINELKRLFSFVTDATSFRGRANCAKLCGLLHPRRSGTRGETDNFLGNDWQLDDTFISSIMKYTTSSYECLSLFDESSSGEIIATRADVLAHKPDVVFVHCAEIGRPRPDLDVGCYTLAAIIGHVKMSKASADVDHFVASVFDDDKKTRTTMAHFDDLQDAVGRISYSAAVRSWCVLVYVRSDTCVTSWVAPITTTRTTISEEEDDADTIDGITFESSRYSMEQE